MDKNILGADFNNDLIDLFAYIVKFDGEVSNEEIEFLDNYLRNKFERDEAEEIFSIFLNSFKKTIQLEKTVQSINNSFLSDYPGKIGLIVNLFELISIDETGITAPSRPLRSPATALSVLIGCGDPTMTCPEKTPFLAPTISIGRSGAAGLPLLDT